MILTKEVRIELTKRNITVLKSNYKLDETLIIGNIAIIPVKLLAKGSHELVDVSCDYCDKILNIPFKRYNKVIKDVNKVSCSNKECSNLKIKDVCLYKYNVENPFQAEFVKEKSKNTLIGKHGVEHQMHLQETKDKIKNTCLEKYGVESPMITEEVKEKIRNTCLERYGVKHTALLEEGQLKRKNTRIKKGYQIPDELVPAYRKYRLSVNRVLNRNKKNILDNWDGTDYYDGEYIKDNFELDSKDRDYPHFDHKISVIYGFKNNIDVDIISNLDNICITKQWINGLKKAKCELEFINEFKK